MTLIGRMTLYKMTNMVISFIRLILRIMTLNKITLVVITFIRMIVSKMTV